MNKLVRIMMWLGAIAFIGGFFLVLLTGCDQQKQTLLPPMPLLPPGFAPDVKRPQIAADAMPAAPLSKTVTLSWGYPSNQLSTNLRFNVYSSTDITKHLSNWVVITNVIGTNLFVKMPLEVGAHFFILTASNSAGESAFATVSSIQPNKK